MAETEGQSIEAWHTTIRLAAAVGRLKIGSNLRASSDAQAKAFDLAGIACGLIAEAATREGPAQIGNPAGCAWGPGAVQVVDPRVGSGDERTGQRVRK